ncbi:MAG TPA: hypothetical protein VNA12_10715 [Mycobacteriales bacterium]|nr:hypothetical protein [Mycobacteriales bacterium]
MPDISDLLSSAAPDVRSEPDLGALERRASALRRRQHVLRAAPALALVLLFSALLLNRTPGAPDELRETDGGTVSTAPRPGLPTVAPGMPVGPLPGRSGAPSREVTAESAEPLPAPTPSGARSVSRRTPPTPTAYPPKRSCRVDTIGLPAGATRSCSFTATHDGGYRVVAAHPGNDVAGDHWVDVTRNGKTTRYGNESAVESHCGSDVIEPGDLVTVGVYRTAGNVMEFEMAAGEGYYCGSYPESSSPSPAPPGPTAGG